MIAPDCPLLPKVEFRAGFCGKCETPLPKGRRRWCSDECARWLYLEKARHHYWGDARQAAIARDGYKCVKCGADGMIPKDVLAALGPYPQAPERQENMSQREWYDSPIWGAYRKQRDARTKAENSLVAKYQLEVNHIVPRNGAGYGPGCHHHLDNLETLCAPCHRVVTKSQRNRVL